MKKRYERDSAEHTRLDAMLNFERVLWRAGVQHIAGVDEVGMGPLAGPVIAAAVVFPPHTALPGIDDSKQLDLVERLEAETRIRAAASAIGIGVAEVGEIDRVNIYQAGLLAMRRAVEALSIRPQHVLVDARSIPGVDVPQNSFHKGDGIDFSIAAASIVAKTHRDRLMDELATQFSGVWIRAAQGLQHAGASGRDPCPRAVRDSSHVVHVHSRALRRVLGFVLRLESSPRCGRRRRGVTGARRRTIGVRGCAGG